MDRVVGPVNLQLMRRLVRKLANLPDEVVQVIHEMLKDWANYMNHLRRVRQRGVYDRFGLPRYTTEPFEWYNRRGSEVARTDPEVQASEPELLAQAYARYPNGRFEGGFGPPWIATSLSWPHLKFRNMLTEVRAYTRLRYYGPGY